ncbi:MAG TPA: hypothetical protein RMF84_09255, partial [Polyangiaceae bacterium LLY-WYZ-14_1]|nr:hypothetical protein [Polyangiaceae bacterium LLY-WYZ-14_1]
MAAFDPGDWAVPLHHLVDETAWAFWLDPSDAVPPLLAGAILGLATATLIGGSARRRRDRRRRRRRARAAWQAEGAAPGWLRGLGYRVVDAQ